jgi:GAF domain-containing protein
VISAPPPRPEAKAALEDSAPPRTSESQRPPGDTLIGRLFEALHTLEFLTDAQAGAEFVMRLVMETLEVEIGIVHLYDINARSFIVASAGGPKADALIELRSPESEPLLAEVMARGKPLLLAEAHGHPLTSSGRWALIDCARAILCAPAQQDGRFLGAIEVANPLDDSAFTEDDVNAISYLAERFTTFLAARGIVLSDEAGDDASAAE